MDLSMLQSIRNERQDSLASGNADMPDALPDLAVEDLKARLPARPNADTMDLYNTSAPFVFVPIYLALLHLGRIWWPTITDDVKAREKPSGVAAALTKKLMHWSQDPSGCLREARIRRGLWISSKLLVMHNYAPLDWQRTVRRIREQAQTASDADLSKDSAHIENVTVWDAQLAMCAETLVDRPIEPLDAGLCDALTPDSVFSNDLAVEPSPIWTSLQYDIDAISRTLQAYIVVLCALTKTYVTALRKGHENKNFSPGNIKAKFQHANIHDSKQTVLIWRNLITDMSLFWIALKHFLHSFRTKDLGHAEKEVYQNIQLFSLRAFFLDTLTRLAESGLKIDDVCQLRMCRLGELSQALMIRLSDLIHEVYEKRSLREKFILCDSVTILWTSYMPTASTVAMTHDKNFVMSVPPANQTNLTDAQFGLDCIEDIDGTSFNSFKGPELCRLLSSVVRITDDLAMLWRFMTEFQLWDATFHEGKHTLFDILPSGAFYKVPSWAMSLEDQNETRKLLNKFHKASEDSLIASLANELDDTQSKSKKKSIKR